MQVSGLRRLGPPPEASQRLPNVYRLAHFMIVRLRFMLETVAPVAGVPAIEISGWCSPGRTAARPIPTRWATFSNASVGQPAYRGSAFMTSATRTPASLSPVGFIPRSSANAWVTQP